MILEKQIEKQILTWLNLQPDIFAFKINTTGVFDPARKIFRKITNPHHHRGTSDILGLCRGLFFAIEVKTPQALKRAISKPSERDLNQMNFLKKVVDCGGDGIRARSLEDVIQFILALRMAGAKKLI